MESIPFLSTLKSKNLCKFSGFGSRKKVELQLTCSQHNTIPCKKIIITRMKNKNQSKIHMLINKNLNIQESKGNPLLLIISHTYTHPLIQDQSNAFPDESTWHTNQSTTTHLKIQSHQKPRNLQAKPRTRTHPKERSTSTVASHQE